jgi:AbrB family looped-hinge helix DNA binding protein
MQITSKGQVTIPKEIRDRLGLLPYTEVVFELAGDHARIRKVVPEPGKGVRGRMVIEALRNTMKGGMSTDEIMALTRGEPEPKKRK